MGFSVAGLEDGEDEGSLQKLRMNSILTTGKEMRTSTLKPQGTKQKITEIV